jgi:hypothetical protein
MGIVSKGRHLQVRRIGINLLSGFSPAAVLSLERMIDDVAPRLKPSAKRRFAAQLRVCPFKALPNIKKL